MTESHAPPWRLLSRPGCGLCEEFLEALAQSAPGLTSQLDVIDVDTDPLLRRRYGHRIPVLLTADGEFVCEVRLDAEALAAALGRAPARDAR